MAGPSIDDVQFTNQPVVTPVASDDGSNSFQKGLRQGTTSLIGQGHALLGRAAETVGLNDAAADQYAQSAAAQQLAATQAPDVTTWDQVHGPSDFGSYVAGIAGQSIPSLVPVVAGGLLAKTPVGKIVAGSLATAPLTIGGQIQEQQADPVQAAAPLADRNLVAGGVGAAQAVGMNVLPGLAEAKLTGALASTGAKQSLKALIAKNVAGGVAINSGVGAGSTLADQAGASYLNPNRDTSGDAAAVKESAIQQGLLSLPFGALGAAGETLHAKALPSLKAAVPDAITDPVSAVKGLFKSKADPDSDAASRLAQGLPLVDDAAYANADPATAAKMEAAGQQTAFEKTMAWGKAILDDNLTPDVKTKVQSALDTAGDAASQAYIAGLKVAKDASAAIQKNASDLLDAVNGRAAKDAADRTQGDGAKDMGQAVPADAPLALRSEGDDGPRLAVANALVDAGADPQVAAANAGSVRSIIDQAQTTGRISDVIAARLHGALGDDAVNLLIAAHDKVAGGDEARTENFYKAIADLNDSQKIEGSLRDQVAAARAKDAAPATRAQLDQAVAHIRRHVDGQDYANLGPAEAKVKQSRVEAALEEHFPGKSKQLLEAFAKDAKGREKTDAVEPPSRETATHKADTAEATNADLDRAKTEAEGTTDLTHGDNFEDTLEKPTYYGGGRDAKNPTYIDSGEILQAVGGKGKPGGQATRLVDRAKAENPDRSIHHVSAVDHAREQGLPTHDAAGKVLPHLEGKGLIEARGHAIDGRLTRAELDDVKLESKNFAQSNARVEHKTGSIDATKLTALMLSKMDKNTGESNLQRKARAFFDGIGAATDALGHKIDLPDDNLQIHRDGTTLGDIKKVKFSSADPLLERRAALRDLSEDKVHAGIETLETQKAEFPRLQEELEQRVAARIEALKAERKKFDKKDVAKIWKEEGSDALRDRIQLTDDLIKASEDELERRATAPGEMEYSPRATGRDAEIHEAAKTTSSKELVNNTGMDGSKNFVSTAGKDSPRVQAQVVQGRIDALKQGKTKIVRDTGAKLEALRDAAKTDLDRQQLARFAKDKDSVRVTQAINKAFKEKGLTLPERAKPVTEAAKKETFVDRVNKGDTKDILDRVATSYDAQGLRDAAQSLFENQSKHSKAVLEKINERLMDLVQNDPTKAYSLQLMHASPHTFEKFDWGSNMGRGEGAQAFGYGGYFASSKDVAAFYKKKFSSSKLMLDGVPFDAPRHNDSAARNALFSTSVSAFKILKVLESNPKDRVKAFVDLGLSEHTANNLAEKLKDVSVDEKKAPLYTVDAKLDPHEILDYDKPLSEQRDILDKIYDNDALDKVMPLDMDIKADRVLTRTEYLLVEKILDGNPDFLDLSKKERYEFLRDKFEKEATTTTRNDPLFKEKNDGYAKAVADRINAIDGLQVDKTRADISNSTGQGLYDHLSQALGGDREASEALDAAGIKGHKYLDGFGRKAGDGNHNYVIYDAQHVDIKNVEHSRENVNAADFGSPASRKIAEDYLAKVVPDVGVAWKQILHAGDFTGGAKGAKDMIALSVHSLNPLSVAYHESLHALFAQLGRAKDFATRNVLATAADTHVVRAQLEKLLANHPEALEQIRTSSEERAAYMYQFWSEGKLTVGDKTKNVFTKVRDFINKLLGTWTNDERAQHIMEYFNSGDYAKDLNTDPNAVAKVLAEGTNPAIEKFKSFVAPFKELGDAISKAGDARLRDTGNPAFIKIADLVLKQGHDVGVGRAGDNGFLPASREARSQVLNKLSDTLKDTSDAHLAQALEQLQSGKKATAPEARIAAAQVRKMLDGMHEYLKAKGVDVGDQGAGKDYFPRVWDVDYLTSHQDDFRAMMAKYGQNNAAIEATLQKLIRGGGAENAIETKTPGFASGKERKLDFISPADFAPFGEKDLWRTLDNYVTQATRRGEWAERFGDDSGKLNALLAEAKEKHGATPEQIAVAEKYIKGINGTLGDNINPKLRRAMGNMMVYQNIRLLPLAVFSSVIDPLGVVVRGGTVGDAFKLAKRGFAEIPRNFQKAENRKVDEGYKLAQDLGTIDNAMLLHTLGSSYSQGMVGNLGRKINDTFFRYNLMEQFNTSMRVGATEAAVKFIGKHADGTFSNHSERWMAELGYKPGEVKLDSTGRPLIRYDDFKAAGMSDADATAAANKMAGAVNHWVDGAILRPNAAHKPIWANDPHFALMAHLKQFVYSFQHTIIDRVVNEAKEGNYKPGVALASYVPIMIAADMAKGLIQGGGQEPSWKEAWGPGDYVWSGVQRAGLLGSGQFLSDAITHKGGILTLLGPTIEQFSDAVQVVGGNQQFKPFFNKLLPGNALYEGFLGSKDVSDPTFSD